ncbi:MAG: DUF58 domain-containing protein [Alphaproteobacteria bacterium]|nr:DUF58 domain-containing protein [Alphaproteobacteria bacterium]MCI5055609.1 DUF58 domain-containing protein [Flavobacteriales bacterium]
MLYPSFADLVALKYKVSQLCYMSERAVSSVAAGGYYSPFRGQGLEFEEVRTYEPGDDIRAIDWRVTARTGRPHTKIFREERERSVILCVDVNVSMRFGTKGTFKSIQAARVAALLGWQATINHDRLGACLFGDVPAGIHFFSPQRSSKPLLKMFKQLSQTNINDNAPYIPLEAALIHMNKAAPTGALVYIIGNFNLVNSALEKQLSALRKRCDIILIPIDDPIDKDIPAVGLLLFSANNSERFLVDTESQEGREHYTTLWLKERESLHKIASKLKIGMIPIGTEVDAGNVLFLGLKHTQVRRPKK